MSKTHTIADLANEVPVFIRIDNVADILGVSQSTVRAMRRRGVLPEPVNLGKQSPRWHLQEVLAWAFLSRGRRPTTHREWRRMRVEHGFPDWNAQPC